MEHTGLISDTSGTFIHSYHPEILDMEHTGQNSYTSGTYIYIFTAVTQKFQIWSYACMWRTEQKPSEIRRRRNQEQPVVVSGRLTGAQKCNEMSMPADGSYSLWAVHKASFSHTAFSLGLTGRLCFCNNYCCCL